MTNTPAGLGRRARLTVALVGAIGLLGARPARADDGQSAPLAAGSAGDTTWYGGQTLICDAGVLTVETTALLSGNLGLAAVGLGGHLFGAPLVHARHGSAPRAFTSLALRVGVPAVGVLAGVLIAKIPGTATTTDAGDGITITAGEKLGALGFLAGTLVASVLDAAVVAREPRKPRLVSALAPVVVPSTGGGTFALVGRF